MHILVDCFLGFNIYIFDVAIQFLFQRIVQEVLIHVVCLMPYYTVSITSQVYH